MDGDNPHTESEKSALAGSNNVTTESTGASDPYDSMPRVDGVSQEDQSGLPQPGTYFEQVQSIPPARVWRPEDSFSSSVLIRRSYTFSFLLFSTALLILAIAGVVAYFLFKHHPAHPLAAWLTILGGVGLCIGMFWLAGLTTRISRGKPDARYSSRSPDERPPSQQRSKARSEDPRDRNQRRIEEYNEIAWSQARGSYRNSQIAMSIGLALLVVGVITTIRQSQTSTQLIIGGLTGLGSAVSAYLGATFIRIYNEAINQMNYYYGQPLVTSYLLEAERMSMALEKSDTRYKVMERVIDATLAGAAEAGQALSPNAGREKTGKQRGRTKQQPNTKPPEEPLAPPDTTSGSSPSASTA
jgi:hypothetical protein